MLFSIVINKPEIAGKKQGLQPVELLQRVADSGTGQ
jgi:hypothetical protein